jgi:hypothetical protein
MLDLQAYSITGLDFEGDLLWAAAPEERLVATYDPATGKTEQILTYRHEVWDVCVQGDQLWLVTTGGTLGRQIVLWSLEEKRETGRFNCPDGAGAGITVLDDKLWLTHPHNRKLFCLDPLTGKTNWVMRTVHETFSPAACGNELWLVESDPGPLGHWSKAHQGKHYFSRYDPVRETIVEHLPVPFTPRCMALDGDQFWYAEKERKGFRQLKRTLASSERNFSVTGWSDPKTSKI